MDSSRLPEGIKIGNAVGAVLLACLALSFGDAMIKQSSTTFTLWQLFTMRSVIAVPLLIFFVRIYSCETPILPQQVFWTLLRSLILVLMWVFYYIALPHIPLTTAAAAYYVLPILITLLAALLLGDRVGAKGWIAVVSGFVGVILVLKPQSESFNIYALLPLLAAACYALAMILTRIKCAREKPLVLSLWLNFSFLAVGLTASLIIHLWNPAAASIETNPFLFDTWKSMWLDEWRLMALLAISIVIGSACAAFAYQSSYSSTIATFDFAYVLFAAFWGFIFFSELPDLMSVLGICMIVGGGILSVWR